MKRVIVSMWSTLDGFVAGPNDEMDWLSVDDEMFAYEIDLVTNAGSLLLGRITHGDFASSWPEVAQDTGADENQRTYARRVDAMDKVVASKRGNTANWKNTHRLADLDRATITALKQQPGGDVVIYGSLSVVNALEAMGMIDEFHLLIHPRFLQGGKALFSGDQPRSMELLSAETFHSGGVLAKYRPAPGSEGR
ncbi:MAG: dihydrofolate reductase family protein [Cryobacterium sp.]|nr:dihydrofolate reductase family protein [Cryobacterium sp.]